MGTLRTRWSQVGRAVLALVVAAVGLAIVTPAEAESSGLPDQARHETASATRRPSLDHDSRRDPASRRVLEARAEALATDPPPRAALRQSLGHQGVLDLDPLTGTPRFVGRTDGFLTTPSHRPATSVALDYVVANASALGVGSDLSTLHLTRDYVDVGGTHHLSWEQRIDGIPLFGNGLQANVTADGRLISLVGSPVANLAAPAQPYTVGAAAAIGFADADARQAIGDDAAAVSLDGDRKATPVLFQTVDGPRRAWRTYVSAIGAPYAFLSIVDGATGEVLYRSNQVVHADGPVFDDYPGSPGSWPAHEVDFTANGWLPAGADRLSGNNAHAFTDLDGSFTAAEPHEEVGPDVNGDFNYPLTTFNDQPFGCSDATPCSWLADLETGGFSWAVNREQAATQAFHFVNTFHDHLEAAPIGFTEAAGNYQLANSSGQGLGGDPMEVHALFGANTLEVDGELVGLPHPDNTNNAFIAPRPDGESAHMALFLTHDPSDPTDTWLPSNFGDSAEVVYHEYTHGMNHRLVVDASGNSTLWGTFQSLAMDEAMSDWFGMDFLYAQGIRIDTAADGEVITDPNITGGRGLRTQAMDCSVGSTAARCQGGTSETSTAGPGGFTYGDMSHVYAYPQIHRDGEIWAETLWDLRTRLGSDVTRTLVTRAMELSPHAPSFLDERNAILQADTVNFGGAHRDAIWSVFANRGMGYFAATTHSVFPPFPLEHAHDGQGNGIVEDFQLPPAPGAPTGTLRGRIVADDINTPVSGVRVWFGTGVGFETGHTAVTGPDGRYEVGGVVAGTYPLVYTRVPGFDFAHDTVTITGGSVTTRDWRLVRNWAAAASVTSFTGPDYTQYGCGPSQLIDQSFAGWGSDSIDATGAPVTPEVIVQLPRAIRITEFGLMPSAVCGDDWTASTRDYRLETSADGQRWTVAAEGTLDPWLAAFFTWVPSGVRSPVRFVRLTLVAPQLWAPCDEVPWQSGCRFIDFRELAVHGV